MLPFIFTLFFLICLPTQATNNVTITTMATASQLVQDNKGFIWLAGQQGLTRFDGHQSIAFSANNKSWPLPFNWLHDIAIDGEELLLATETDGLWRFSQQTGKTEKIPLQIPRKSLYEIAVFQGSYYIYAPDKLYSYDKITNRSYLIDENIKINKIASNKNNLYISSTKGLFVLKNNKLQQLLTEPTITITALASSVIAITRSNIYRVDEDGSMTNINTSANHYAAVKEFDSDNFFTITNKGVVSKFSGKDLQYIEHKYGNIKPQRIRSILHDSSGVLWLVSTQGIQHLTENTLKNHPRSFDIPINANRITLFQNEIIFGTYGAGLQNFIAPIFDASVNNSFSNQGLRITDMVTINGILYIASFDGLWFYNDKSQQVQKIDFPYNDKLILKLAQKDNLLYFGTNHHGVYLYDISQNKILDNINIQNGISSSEVIDILPLDSSNTWLATCKGVDIVNNSTKTIRNLKVPGASKVISLLKKGGKIFAATLGDGIYAFSLQGELLAQFGQGVRYNQMMVVEDEVWITARPGLYKFNPTNYHISMVENSELYSFAGGMILHDNIVYASHYSGILSIDLTPKSKFDPKVYISKTTVSGKYYLLNKAIKINSGNDVITLDLASLDYRPGVEKQYRYTLDGSKWHQINGNQLTLTGLASGEYHIEIMATNSLGQWSKYKAFTEISVAFPWYWTPQIRLVYVVSLICLFLIGAWLIFLRSKSISHIHSILQNDINNYGKTSMQVKRSLTAALSLISQNELNKGKLLLQQCIDDLNEQQKSPEPNSLNGSTLTEAVPFLIEYLHNKYQVRLYYQIDIDENELDYELQADLYRVIFEAVTSSILSGNGRNFKVVLQKFKSKIWLNISNDSQSFIHFNSKVNFDISMYYIRQIAKKHKGSVNTFEKQDKGSQLVLSLPIIHGKQIHLKQVSASSKS